MKRMNLHTHGEQYVLLSFFHWMVTRDFNYQISSFQWFFSSYGQTPCMYIPLMHSWLIQLRLAGDLMSTCLDIPLLFFPNIFVLVCEHPAHRLEWRTILQGHRHYAINTSKIPHKQEFIKNLWYILGVLAQKLFIKHFQMQTLKLFPLG